MADEKLVRLHYLNDFPEIADQLLSNKSYSDYLSSCTNRAAVPSGRTMPASRRWAYASIITRQRDVCGPGEQYHSSKTGDSAFYISATSGTHSGAAEKRSSDEEPLYVGYGHVTLPGCQNATDTEKRPTCPVP